MADPAPPAPSIFADDPKRARAFARMKRRWPEIAAAADHPLLEFLAQRRMHFRHRGKVRFPKDLKSPFMPINRQFLHELGSLPLRWTTLLAMQAALDYLQFRTFTRGVAIVIAFAVSVMAAWFAFAVNWVDGVNLGGLLLLWAFVGLVLTIPLYADDIGILLAVYAMGRNLESGLRQIQMDPLYAGSVFAGIHSIARGIMILLCPIALYMLGASVLSVLPIWAAIGALAATAAASAIFAKTWLNRWTDSEFQRYERSLQNHYDELLIGIHRE